MWKKLVTTRIDSVPDPDDMAARSRQLAKDLLDEMDKPKSPKCEAYEAQKERADREALERFYIATGQIKPEQVAPDSTGFSGKISNLLILLPLFYDGSCDCALCINGKSRAERPST